MVLLYNFSQKIESLQIKPDVLTTSQSTKYSFIIMNSISVSIQPPSTRSKLLG